MEIQVVNLTPHAVVVLAPDGVVFDPRTRSSRVEDGHTPVVLRCYEPTAGAIPRCTQVETDLGELDGVPLVGMKFGEVENLPEARDGVYYIVSSLVAQAGRKVGRSDLLIPAKMVRDQDGNILGCLALAAE